MPIRTESSSEALDHVAVIFAARSRRDSVTKSASSGIAEETGSPHIAVSRMMRSLTGWSLIRLGKVFVRLV